MRRHWISVKPWPAVLRGHKCECCLIQRLQRSPFVGGSARLPRPTAMGNRGLGVEHHSLAMAVAR